ncbi:hypothetical protein SAY86_031849 [Trapa natans]|uniref:J domain-containing protein n=1 Tax=Trapa natans TaxID=22666 RepID=A0AAN7M7T1_TRANT|nr:hypothetical protein SAY86_031849 [Trapa natans]
MRRKRMSGDGFYPSACTGKGTLRGCTKRGNLENVVVFDVDDDVIIIDDSDSFGQNFQGPSISRREREVRHHTVISIDDEDSDVDHPGVGVTGVSELDSDATSSKRSSRTSDISRNPLDFDVNQLHTVEKEKSPSKLSDCRKPYSEKVPSRNRYGLSPEPEEGLSESDYSDCEVLEGSSEELREQWERISSKQKNKCFNCRHGTEDQASTSAFHAGADMNVEQDRDGIYGEPVFSFSTDEKVEEDLFHGNYAYFNTRHPEDLRRRESSRPCPETDSLGSQRNVQTRFVTVDGNVQFGTDTCPKQGPADSQHGKPNGNSVNTHSEDQGPKDSCSSFNAMGGTKQNDCAEENLEKKDERTMEASFHHLSQSENDDDEEFDSYRSQVSGEANMPERTFPSGVHQVSVSTEEFLRDQLMQKSNLSDGINTCKDGDDKGDHMGKLSTNFNHNLSHDEPQEKPKLWEKISCSMKYQEPLLEPVSKTQSSEERTGDCSPTMQDNIINGREKQKETDEYRQAQEKEWASRQRQLQLQAEEAQRLKKRKKAEALRLLDMERRQKQRVEEMRKTQQKDEENMNLKEKLRAEIRKELDRLEMSCIDMASLLRGLGIQVGSSPSPISQEVHSAYKRALLRFHPDRASRNDIRQQVEAEEKFKLISRMKEKFLLTSCH